MSAAMRAPVLLALWLMLSGQAQGSTAPPISSERAQVLGCLRTEEVRRGLPGGLLIAIAKTESGLDAHALGRNRNGTYDIGLMQINSIHLPRLRAKGVEPAHLWHPCVNAAVGAMILQEFMQRHGVTWKAVAAYNTGRPAQKPTAAQRYVDRVQRNWRLVLGQQQSIGIP